MVRGIGGDAPKRLKIADANLFTILGDQPLCLESAQYPRYGLYRQTQIPADIAPRHRECECGRAITLPALVVRLAQEKRCQSLVRAFLSEQ